MLHERKHSSSVTFRSDLLTSVPRCYVKLGILYSLLPIWLKPVWSRKWSIRLRKGNTPRKSCSMQIRGSKQHFFLFVHFFFSCLVIQKICKSFTFTVLTWPYYLLVRLESWPKDTLTCFRLYFFYHYTYLSVSPYFSGNFTYFPCWFGNHFFSGPLVNKGGSKLAK